MNSSLLPLIDLSCKLYKFVYFFFMKWELLIPLKLLTASRATTRLKSIWFSLPVSLFSPKTPSPNLIFLLKSFISAQASLVSIRLTKPNLLLCKSLEYPLVRSLGLSHHLMESGKPSEIIVVEGGKEIINLEFATWLDNDNLLTTWLLGTIDKKVLPKLDIQSLAYKV